MDEVNHDIVAIEVTKYVQGDFGTEVRTLSLQDGTNCSINVYQDEDMLHTKTMKVGKDGIGLLNDYDVVAGSYDDPAYAQISEDADSVADAVTDAEGNKWTYVYSYVETEFAWRNDGNNNPSRYRSKIYTKDDDVYLSESEVIGEYTVEGGIPYEYKGVQYDGVHEYNRFEEFYVYNIYKQIETVDVPIDKTWYDEEGNLINDDDPDYDWTATFVLEEREVHESGEVSDKANTKTWKPVEGIGPLTIHKGDIEDLRSFKNLPKCRYYYDAEGNESKYRIMYSVSETAYTLTKNGSVISKWDSVNGLTEGSIYFAPQFPHDAGDADDNSSIGENDPNFYHIIVTNHVSNEEVTTEIEITLSKEWPEHVLDDVENPSATFQLKRYKKTEYYEQQKDENQVPLLDEDGKPIWVPAEGTIADTEDSVFTTENHLYTLNQHNEWSLAIPRLTRQSEYVANGEKTVYTDSYYFEEVTSNPAGFYAVIRTSGDAPIIVDESHRIEDTGTEVVAENRPAPETLLYKVDEKDIDQDIEGIGEYLLPRAQFKVIKYTSASFEVKDTSWGDRGEKTATRKDGDPDGKFMVDGLVPGFYELAETAYPTGYIQTTKNPQFKVVVVDAERGELDIQCLSPNAAIRIVDNVIIYGNTPGVALPSTGGPGTILCTLGGMALLAMAALMGYCESKRRRAEKR